MSSRFRQLPLNFGLAPNVTQNTVCRTQHQYIIRAKRIVVLLSKYEKNAFLAPDLDEGAHVVPQTS